jgi:Ala-tRNA(Pro) deacylase
VHEEEAESMTISTNVKSYLEERNVAYELVSHPITGSSHESAEAAHVDEDRVAKAVILTDAQGGVMVVIPGDMWVKVHAVGDTVGREELQLADEASAAGFFPDCDSGAIPPLGPAYGMETLLDEALTSRAFVYFESGDHRTLVKTTGDDFLSLLEGARRGLFCDLR